MERTDLDDLKATYQTWPDDQLIEVLSKKNEDFTPDAIELIKEELKKRNISLSDNIHSTTSKPYYLPPDLRNPVTDSKWDKFKSKYGYGWLVLAFVYIRENKTVNLLFGENASLFQLAGFIISLFFYYLFRQKTFIKINKILIRSVVSGIISIILTAFCLFILNLLVSKK